MRRRVRNPGTHPWCPHLPACHADVRFTGSRIRTTRVAQIRISNELGPHGSVDAGGHFSGLHGRMAQVHGEGHGRLGHAGRRSRIPALHQGVAACHLLVSAPSSRGGGNRRQCSLHAGVQGASARDLEPGTSPGHHVRHHGRVLRERTLEDRHGLCGMGLRGCRPLGGGRHPGHSLRSTPHPDQHGQDQLSARGAARLLPLYPPLRRPSWCRDTELLPGGRDPDR